MKYKANYKYQLQEDTTFRVRPKFPMLTNRWYSLRHGVLMVYKDYAWDGASGPTIDTAPAVYASLAHDVLYQAMREGELDLSYREVVDQEFRRLLIERGMSRFRAGYWYYALRWAGRKAALPESSRKVLEA